MAVSGNQGVVTPIGSRNYGKPVNGPRAIANVQTARQVPQWDPKILDINKDITPLLVFMKKFGRSRTINNVAFNHSEQDMLPATVTIDDGTSGLGAGSGYDSTDTSIGFGVAAGYLGGSGLTRLNVNDVLKYVPTGEMMLVTAINYTTGIATVTRGFTSANNGAAAAAIPANAELQLLGNTFPDNSQAPNSISAEPLILTHYIQMMRTAIEAGKRLQNMENYGGDEYPRMIAQALEAHQVSKEKFFLFNQGYVASGQTVTDGFINQIVSNVFQMNGVLDEVTLEEYWKSVTRFNMNGDSVITFVGENVLSCIDQFGRDGVRYDEKTNSIGVAVQEWKSAFGTINFKRHGLFGPLGGSTPALSGGYTGLMVTACTKNLGEITMKGGKLNYDPDCALPGQWGDKAAWTEDAGLVVYNERTHGVINYIDRP